MSPSVATRVPTQDQLNSSGRHKVSLQAVHSSGSAGRQPGGSGSRHFFDTLPELLSNGSTGSKGGGSSQCSHTLRGQLRDAKQQAEALRSENDALKVRCRIKFVSPDCCAISYKTGNYLPTICPLFLRLC